MTGNKDDLDLGAGFPLASLPDGQPVAGRLGDETLVLVRRGDDVRAFGGTCTHLGAPLADGIVVGDTLRCPWHHACFSLETGEAVAAPAFAPLRVQAVEVRDGIVRAGPASPVPRNPRRAVRQDEDGDVVIVGTGAGGFAAADRLLRAGYPGRVTVVSEDPAEPYDRTLLTKDYLDGRKGDDELGLSPVSLRDLGAELRVGTRVERIDRNGRRVVLADGTALPYGHLVLAPGAEPRRLDVPGAAGANVHLLRSLADCRGILAALDQARTVVVVGGSFIGTEAAASLRDRKLSVHLVAPDAHPLEKALGRALSDLVVDTHTGKGVTLHLGRSVRAVARDAVELDDGTRIACDLVVVGLGVTPRTALAEAADLPVEDGILVDDRLRTADPRIFAIGDAAYWPDPRGGERVRIEHWALAERQGQFVADTIMGRDARFDVVPFFWTKQFDLSIRYVGHVDKPERITVDGDVAKRDAVLGFETAGRVRAIATVGRDKASLEAEQRLADFAEPSRP